MGNPRSHSFLGTYVPDLYIATQNLQKWQKQTIITIEECRKCSHALLCGGGCANFALTEEGYPEKGVCEDFKEQMKVCLPAALKRVGKT